MPNVRLRQAVQGELPPVYLLLHPDFYVKIKGVIFSILIVEVRSKSPYNPLHPPPPNLSSQKDAPKPTNPPLPPPSQHASGG